MKKNKMMRVASFLLVAVLLSTSVISGTFAKYVTEGSAEDVARVAKFGVTITADGALFADTYKTTSNLPGASGDSTGAAALSVVSSAVTGTTTDHDGVDGLDKVVAPGAKSTDNGLQIAVAGQPEVAVKLTVTLKDNEGNEITTKAQGDAKDVFLKAIAANAGYADMTTGDANDVFTLAADYHPVKYTLTGGSGVTAVNDGTLGDVIASLAALNDQTFDANTDLASVIGTLKLTWKWDFYVDDATDKADTLLGDLAANNAITAKTADSTANPIVWSALTADSDFYLKTGLTIEITIEQVD